MEKDLILGVKESGEEEDVESTISEEEFDFYSGPEMIAAACAALDTAEQANPMTKTDKARIDRIRRKSVAIIDKCINELYEVCFPARKEENLEDEE
jgi:hypothetical protein